MFYCPTSVRAAARVALAVTLAVAWCACGGSPHARNGRITIRYWEKWTGFEADAMRAVVDDFNASQNHVFVDFSSVSQMDRRLMLAISGGVPPDLAGVTGKNAASLRREQRSDAVGSAGRAERHHPRQIHRRILENLLVPRPSLGAADHPGLPRAHLEQEVVPGRRDSTPSSRRAPSPSLSSSTKNW